MKTSKPLSLNLIALAAVAMTLLIFACCLAIGPGAPGQRSVSLGFPGWAILQLRLTRVAAAAIAGGALGLAGVLLQGLLRNPLADPFVLGISSGSTVGVMIWIVFGDVLLQSFAGHPWLMNFLSDGQSIPALAGAIAATLLVFLRRAPYYLITSPKHRQWC